jgi:alanyl-tRNA synthetase
MESQVIRQKFLDFFKEKGHKIVPSAPLVVKNDPTLMFTNAGMNQFKDFFLGTQKSKNDRVADTQKCLRVSGKHNDLEEVGIDTYHHTMFEMLGNWSFGDYFKEEAISWAWELLTGVYGLPRERIYATVFGGDRKDGLEVDDEARIFWREFLPAERILDGAKKDNFWEMGDTGPCGPCSEIHIDLRSQEEIDKVPGVELVNEDHPQVVEIWNLVFIQFNRLASGELADLPAKHVDTGMGFERLVMAIQKKKSNYDTDVFQPLIQIVAKKASVTYGDDEKTDIALRVIVDHIRAIAFAIADGQLPSNTGAGYVIRRILRRAVRYGFQFLGFNQPFLADLLPELDRQFATVFPELNRQIEFIGKVISEEESGFLRTLEHGLGKLETIKNELAGSGAKMIDGVQAFELYDTFGFPLDLTSLIARENGLSVDVDGFDKEMKKQQDRSKADAEKETGDWIILDNGSEVEFVGYETTESDARILRYRTVKQKGKEQVQIVLSKTPFYAESGGQVGDTGYLDANGERISIVDTKKENDLIVHFADQLPSVIDADVHVVVNAKKRLLTMNNHSATHLMHAALREILGAHVEQRGSLVNHKVLRFDFSHFAKMTDEEIKAVEDRVNEKIRENIQLDERREVPIEEAKAQGAMALFGEKYGEHVRMIIFDQDYSVELCGGTHVPATGQIGLFKIVAESSIAAGIRRIEAITAVEAEKYVHQQEVLFKELKELLKNPKDIMAAVRSLVQDKNRIEKELEILQREKITSLKEVLIAQAREESGVNVIMAQLDLPDTDALKQLGFALKKQVDNLFLVLAANINGKPQIAVVLDDKLVQERGWHAGNMVRELAQSIKGGGGGQPFFATAGGSDLSGLDEVLTKARDYLKS